MQLIYLLDFASDLKKNRKMWTISYPLRWINNDRVLLFLACQNTSPNVFHKQLCFLNKINLSGWQWESRVLVKIGASIRSFPSWWQIRTLKRKVHPNAGCLNDSFFTWYSLGLRGFWKKRENRQLAFKVTKPFKDKEDNEKKCSSCGKRDSLSSVREDLSLIHSAILT